MSLWRENLLLYICSRFGEALQTFSEASTQMPPARVFILGKRFSSGGFVSLHSFYWSSLVFKFGSLLWPAEPSFRRHGLHWRSLRNKKVEGILDVEAHALEIWGNFFKTIWMATQLYQGCTDMAISNISNIWRLNFSENLCRMKINLRRVFLFKRLQTLGFSSCFVFF